LFVHRDPIFDKLYDLCCCNPICTTAYLESLEPFILNDQLRAVPPTIVKEFFTHYEALGNYKVFDTRHMHINYERCLRYLFNIYLRTCKQALEACTVHLNVESLDIHQTMKICWTQGLYDAIIYIYNHGMRDYVAPFEELMTELQSALAAGSNLNTFI